MVGVEEVLVQPGLGGVPSPQVPLGPFHHLPYLVSVCVCVCACMCVCVIGELTVFLRSSPLVIPFSSANLSTYSSPYT